MYRAVLFPALIVALAVCPASAAGPDLWLHVRVEEPDNDTKVMVNLPFSLVGKALPMVDVGDHLHEDSIHVNGRHLSYEELRDIWLEMRDGPDMDFVTIEEHDESVRIWKESGYLMVRVRDRKDERVDVRMPLEVVDALLGRKGELDFPAALEVLAARGEGELVSVQGDDESVRIWVDRSPEPEAGR